MAINNVEISFTIVEFIGVLKNHLTGWRKELNLVCWNGGEVKYDIRDWNENHQRMSRGVTFTVEEASKLKELLNLREEL